MCYSHDTLSQWLSVSGGKEPTKPSRVKCKGPEAGDLLGATRRCLPGPAQAGSHREKQDMPPVGTSSLCELGTVFERRDMSWFRFFFFNHFGFYEGKGLEWTREKAKDFERKSMIDI